MCFLVVTCSVTEDGNVSSLGCRLFLELVPVTVIIGKQAKDSAACEACHMSLHIVSWAKQTALRLQSSIKWASAADKISLLGALN